MPQPLPVPYHPQNSNGFCLAACAQMVLHYWGIMVDQAQIAQQLGVQPGVGAPAGRITRLTSHRLRVIYDVGEWEVLQAWLDKQIPLIAMIQAGELPHWLGEYFQHAVVVTGYARSHVWLLDPAAPPETLVVPIDDFMLAWGEMDFRYAVLEPLLPQEKDKGDK